MPNASVAFAFVPGILSVTEPWSAVMPDGCRLVPVEYHPEVADASLNVAAGDFVDVAALRLLRSLLGLAATGAWAVGAHSAGGTVLYQCLDFFMQLQEPSGADALLHHGKHLLPHSEFSELIAAVHAHHGRPPSTPLAVLIFEGTLMPCDVEGWADDWATMQRPPDEQWIRDALSNPDSKWTWDMARLCAGACYSRCASEPPRHLATLRSWLALSTSPGITYVAGERSASRNERVFPALRNLSHAGGALLQIIEVKGAGHNMHRDAPGAVRDIIAGAMGLGPVPRTGWIDKAAAFLPWFKSYQSSRVVGAAGVIFLVAALCIKHACKRKVK